MLRGRILYLLQVLPSPIRQGDQYRKQKQRIIDAGFTIPMVAARGPLCTASFVRGIDPFMVDLVEDPAAVHQLLTYTTEAIIRWIEAQAEAARHPVRDGAAGNVAEHAQQHGQTGEEAHAARAGGSQRIEERDAVRGQHALDKLAGGLGDGKCDSQDQEVGWNSTRQRHGSRKWFLQRDHDHCFDA